MLNEMILLGPDSVMVTHVLYTYCICKGQLTGIKMGRTAWLDQNIIEKNWVAFISIILNVIQITLTWIECKSSMKGNLYERNALPCSASASELLHPITVQSKN